MGIGGIGSLLEKTMNKKGDVMDIAYAMVFIFIGAVVFFISTFSYDKFADQALNTSVINSMI